MDTLATALYVRADDLLKESPHLAPERPHAGISPQLSDAELITLAVMQPLLGFRSEARWVRYAHAHLRHLFPYLPLQPGYNKRLRAAAGLMLACIRVLAASTSLRTDDVWVVDSTPVECGRSRETAKRSDLAGWAEYGYCASHSRYFWGLRLHLVCTLHGLPVAFALTGAKADERETLLDLPRPRPRPGRCPAGTGPHRRQELLRPRLRSRPRRSRLDLLRPARKGEPPRPGPVLQTAAPDHRIGERHPQGPTRPRTPRRAHPDRGVIVRVLQRILALTAAIWHNDHTGQPVMRSLLAYDH